MNTGKLQSAASSVPLAATLTASGYIRTQLYLHGYRFVHAIGVMSHVPPAVHRRRRLK